MNTRRMAGAAAASALALGGITLLASPAMAADGDAPADVVQGVGMPASGTCVGITDTALNWSGVPSGGWTAGWGQWLNNGTGGVACVRTLKYDVASATWSVAA